MRMSADARACADAGSPAPLRDRGKQTKSLKHPGAAPFFPGRAPTTPAQRVAFPSRRPADEAAAPPPTAGTPKADAELMKTAGI